MAANISFSSSFFCNSLSNFNLQNNKISLVIIDLQVYFNPNYSFLLLSILVIQWLQNAAIYVGTLNLIFWKYTYMKLIGAAAVW